MRVRRSEVAAYGEVNANGSEVKLSESIAIARVDVGWLIRMGELTVTVAKSGAGTENKQSPIQTTRQTAVRA